MILVTAIPDEDGIDQVSRKVIPAMFVKMLQGGGGMFGKKMRETIVNGD